MRSYDDVVQEMLALRESERKCADEAQKMRAEIKTLKTELDWWRKTFGPSEVAPR